MAIKAVLFDADNTLYKVRAEKAYARLFNYIAGEANSDAKTVENIWRGHINNILKSEDARSAEKRKREYSIEIVLGQLGIVDAEKVMEITKKALELFWQQVIDDLEYEAESASVIARIREKFRVAVASDEYRENLEGKLNHVFGGWKKYFEFLISAGDTGELKPS
ncbi:MAG: HAD family hydrolase, partial [Candidatus Aenigmarchaeota archaeon]|nr:HAD family hydrolase [Candidatus Aenigmarchaeota archaeon]